MKLIEKYLNDFTLFYIDSEKDFAQHEKMLYKAFFSKYPWYSYMCFDVIDNRLISKIPYKDQLIFQLIKNNYIVSGYSYCINYKQTFDIERMGFKIKKDETICSGLHFYSNLDRKYNSLEVVTAGLKASKYIDNILRNKGIKTIYSSCEENYVNSYKKIGFERIGEIKNEIFEEILLIRNL